jgi:hypothetical protein
VVIYAPTAGEMSRKIHRISSTSERIAANPDGSYTSSRAWRYHCVMKSSAARLIGPPILASGDAGLE